MNTRQLLWGLAGVASLAIAFVVGFLVRPTNPPTNRVVTISATPAPGTGCEVDYPVASLRDNGIDQIKWVSGDGRPYWISFTQLFDTPQGYTTEDPLTPPQDFVGVSSKYFKVKYDSKHAYYIYAIYDLNPQTNPPNPHSNPPTNPPCKSATLDPGSDPGVIVKR
jgi:hypothetical protein